MSLLPKLVTCPLFLLPVLAVVGATLAPARAPAATAFEAPPPNLLYQLDKQNRHRPWLRITADTARWTVRVRGFDPAGPSGLDVRKQDPPAPARLSWGSIARIDEVVTRERRGRVLGFLVGGGLGLGLGNMIGASDGGGWSEGMIGLLIAGNAGAWIGGRWGESMVREEPWYVGVPAAPAATRVDPIAPPASADSTSRPPISADPVVRPGDEASAAAVSRSPRVLRACARIGRGDLIRVRGDFGLFQGFATVAGPQGLDGLRADRRPPRASTVVPVGLVPWDRIDYVDRRGGSAGRGALMGGMSLGIVGGLLSFALVSALGNNSSDAVGAMFAGAGVMGGIGAVIGGAIGAGVPAWHNVYDGP